MMLNCESQQTLSQAFSWLCPDLTSYWQLARIKDSQEIVLKSGERQYRFLPAEGYALTHFTGRFTVAQVQQRTAQKFPGIAENFVFELLQKLVNLGILTLEGEEWLDILSPPQAAIRLKACVQWIEHPDGYWLLRNPEDITFLQLSDRHHQIIAELTQFPKSIVTQNLNTTPNEINYLMHLLAATAMLEGSQPPKPPKRKFTPLQLLFFKVRLFNPDPWLDRQIHTLRWIWTTPVAAFMLAFLSLSAAVGFSQKATIVHTGQLLWKYQGSSLVLSFGLLVALVVTLHELGHAFTLKHYGGIVPEMGFLFMFLMPAAYTNTTDSYCLSRFKRIQVIAAGILVQIAIAAFAFWLWEFSAEGLWLHTVSYLLMVAALFTIALNLNPLAKFDGYYLAVAITGINNLRSRSFRFYQNLFSLRPITEKKCDRLILATYAPFSFLYIQWYSAFCCIESPIGHSPPCPQPPSFYSQFGLSTTLHPPNPKRSDATLTPLTR